MGHRIDYSFQTFSQDERRRGFRLPLMALFCFFVFLILVHFLWPEGKQFLLNIVSLRGELAVFSVLNTIANELGSGGEVTEAFSVLLEYFT